MANNTPFYPQTVQASGAVGTSASIITLPTTTDKVGTCQYYVVNNGANFAYFTFFPAGTPAANITTSVATGVPLLPNSAQTFSGPPNGFMAVIAGTAGNTMLIVGGEGV